MPQSTIFIETCPQELQSGMAEIQKEYPQRFGATTGSTRVIFVHDNTLKNGGLSTTKGKDAIIARYGRPCDAFRTLGKLMGVNDANSPAVFFSETPQLDMAGVMIDVSRNGVLRPDAAKAFMRRCALMGINMLMLYMEDTYAVPDEPFFGYLRGRYTHDELKDLDNYARALGIEMIPCIQTLGHLSQILQWPAYRDYRDTDEVILANDEKTYQLIEKMITAASAPFRSKRIHIGMDEAYGLGTGEYKKRFGEANPFSIFNNHLARVRTICRKLGLKPMIWGDMYFSLGSKTHSYYDRNIVIPPEVIAQIPKDVEMVYWDYYHTDVDFYAERIDRYRALGSEPVMAGGVWTWVHFWSALPMSITTTNACLTACKQKGLKQAFVTMWGDDGMECDIFSALPGIQYFAEHCYTEAIDETQLRRNFFGSCHADYDDWMKVAEIDAFPWTIGFEKSACNASKWLLWDDPLIGLLDPQVDDHNRLSRHYAQLADILVNASEKTAENQRLLFPALLARVLSVKCRIRRNISDAYHSGDKVALRRLVDSDLAVLRASVDELWKYHRRLWLSLYKPFGLEALEHRYGGLLARLDSLTDRLRNYLDGAIDSIPELETKLEQVYPGEMGHIPAFWYARLATPSMIK